jgi:hypothetical protein
MHTLHTYKLYNEFSTQIPAVEIASCSKSFRRTLKSSQRTRIYVEAHQGHLTDAPQVSVWWITFGSGNHSPSSKLRCIYLRLMKAALICRVRVFPSIFFVFLPNACCSSLINSKKKILIKMGREGLCELCRVVLSKTWPRRKRPKTRKMSGETTLED